MNNNPVKPEETSEKSIPVVKETAPDFTKEDYEKVRKGIEENLFSVFRKYIN